MTTFNAKAPDGTLVTVTVPNELDAREAEAVQKAVSAIAARYVASDDTLLGLILERIKTVSKRRLMGMRVTQEVGK